jgi:hypothetical protein
VDTAREAFRKIQSGETSYLNLTDEEQKALGSVLSSDQIAMLSQGSVLEGAQLESANRKFTEAEFGIKVDGLEDLEKAGKLLEGTSKLVDELRKGGKFEIEARINLTSNLYKEAQLDAMLNSGNQSLIDQAVQQITGVSGQRYYDNKEYWLDQAKEQRAVTRALTEGQIIEGYENAQDKVAYLQSLKGTGWSIEEKTLPDGHSIRRAVYNPEDYVFENPFAGKEVQYTNLQLANMRAGILSGALKPKDIGYETALTSGGKYWQNYQTLLANGASEDELKKARELALKEESEALKEAIEEDALENGRINATTIGGALGYANIRYKQSNKVGLAANSIYEALSSGNIKTVADLSSVVNSQDVENWKDLLDSSEDVRKAFDEMGATVGEDGTIDFSNVESSAEGVSSALQSLIVAVTEASEAYSKMHEVLSTGEVQERALNYLAGVGPEESGFEAYSQYVGNSQLAQVVRNNWLQNEEYRNFMDLSDAEKAAYIQGHKGTPTPTSLYSGLNDYEYNYAKQLEENAAKGISGLTSEQRYEGAMQIAQAAQQGQEALDELRKGGRIGAFDDYLSGINNIDQILADLASGDPDKAAKALKNFNEQLSARKAEDVTRYSKGANNMASILTKMKKGGKDASEGLAIYRKNLETYQDQMTAIDKAKGKSGKGVGSQTREILASLFEGIDAKDIEKMTKEQLADLLEGAPDAINQAFADDLQAQLDASTVNIDVSGIDVNADGQISLEELEAAYRAAGDEAVANALAMAGHYADIDFTVDKENSHISVDAVVNATKKYNNKGGGGGGGKSAVDKLLEAQKRKIAEIEHQNKMIQIEEKTYDYKNDYTSYRDNLQEQVDMQYKLRTAYTENIKEMEELLAKTKEGSDDWYKLRDAIYAAQEALAEINNTINDINSKNISILQDELENADKPLTHRLNMLQKYASRAMSEDRFNDYLSFSEQNIAATRQQRAGNTEEINRWKQELSKYEKDSDAWREIRDKIWALEEENAELDNQLVQMELDLGSQKLAQVAKVLQQNSQTAAYNQNVASAYAGAYQSGGYRLPYEEMILEQQKANASLIAMNKQAEASARAQMETLTEGSTAWFEAQAAVYQYREAIAQTEVSQIELNRALAESKLESISENYNDVTRELTHVNEMLSEQAQEYLSTNDYEAYYEAMNKYMENLPEIILAQQNALSSLQTQFYEGVQNGTLDPALQRQYLDEINNRESEIQKLILEQRQKQREIDKTRLDQMFTEQDYAASEYDHNMRLLGYENSKYQNNGELTNVNIMIRTETEMRKNRVATLQEELEALEKEHELFKDGSEEEKRIVEQIKKHEEAIASENTQIDKNNKLLSENEKKIMQVRKTLEDAVDKEIEAEKKRQREILSANVNMQNTIVELLKKRLQDEWNLKKKDIDKEKESLNEYKKLITERFNYRKKASQQADKDEEIADYRRQLALIEADPSRSKDAKELRRKIEDLEKEKAWATAEDELAAETERVDEQIEGMDKFVQYNEELLNEILGDANNFAVELGDILNGSFEESYTKIIEFMRKENEAFMKSLPEAQEQMIQGWKDTWKQANDIVDNNIILISELLETKEQYMDFMKSTDRDYRSYQDEQAKALADNDVEAARRAADNLARMEREWSDKYDDYTKAIKDDAIFTSDSHVLTDVSSQIDELKNNVFKVNVIGIDDTNWTSMYGLSRDQTQTVDFSNGEQLVIDELTGIFKKVEQKASIPKATAEDKGTGTGSTTKKKNTAVANKNAGTTGAVLADNKYSVYYDAVTGKYSIVQDENGELTKAAATIEADQANKGKINRLADADLLESKTDKKGDEGYIRITGSALSPVLTSILEDTLYHNANGGLVDYTGLAWVDGTKARPESFLDATDTQTLRSMLDTFTYIKNQPYMTSIDPSMVSHNSSVGDINITINQAELQSDADYDKVARKVGQAFTKELSRQGLNLSGYAF